MPYYHTDAGVRLHYVGRGPTSPPPEAALLFQHDIGGDLEQVSRLLAAPRTSLTDGEMTIVHADFRAHGRSEIGCGERLSVGALASDLAALLDHLELNQAILGGIGLGAAAALRLAVDRPERCRALILCQPAWVGGTMNAVARHALGLIATLLAADDWERSAAARLERDGVFRHVQAVCGEAARELRESLQSVMAHPETREATIARLRDLPRSRALDDLDALETLECPTLILAEHTNPLHPFECASELADCLPNSRLVPTAFPSRLDDCADLEDLDRAVGGFVRAVLEGREHPRPRVAPAPYSAVAAS